jgi:branched-chain amino acid transport system substrate-binding protein
MHKLNRTLIDVIGETRALFFLGFVLLLLCVTYFVEPAAAEVKEIKVGWIGPLTGNSAVLGVDSLKAVQMAFDEINHRGGIEGFTLKLVAEDDQYSASKTLSAYRKLVAVDKVKFVFVITYGGLFAIADQVKRDGVIAVDPLDCDEAIAKLNDHVLCVAKTTESLGELAAEDAVKHGNTPVGILYFEGDPFPQATAENARARLAELGIKPAVFEGYVSSSQDFRSLVEKLKAAKVKALFMYGYDEMGLLTRQVRDLGLSPQIYSFGTVTSPGFLSSAQGSAENAIIVAWFGEGGERLDKFLEEFHKQNNRNPFLHISTVPSYDVANIFAGCLEKGGIDKTQGAVLSEYVLECLYALKNYQGISGSITMDKDGITRSFSHSIKILKGSTLEQLPLRE